MQRTDSALRLKAHFHARLSRVQDLPLSSFLSTLFKAEATSAGITLTLRTALDEASSTRSTVPSLAASSER